MIRWCADRERGPNGTHWYREARRDTILLEFQPAIYNGLWTFTEEFKSKLTLIL
jgi:hypothetical protein